MIFRSFKIAFLIATAVVLTHCADNKSSNNASATPPAGNNGSGNPSEVPSDNETPSDRSDCLTNLACQMQDKINAYRKSQGKSELSYDAFCANSSFKHAKDMFDNSYFYHINFANEGPYERYMKLASKSPQAIDENLARFSGNVEEIFQAWLASTSHRDTILDDNFTHHGVGVYVPTEPVDPNDASKGTRTLPEKAHWVHCFVKL
ncbi:MAG: CAP domain-containing protein [Bdellovibrionales bacterium]|nr:CAP domain-containing protein [Bdellovibrionales bacterium]